MAFLDNIGLTKLIQLIKGSLPTKATSSTLGLVKPDNSTITVDSDGVISSSGGISYTLPTASTSTLGGVKIDGSTITIDANGVISTGFNLTYDNSASGLTATTYKTAIDEVVATRVPDALVSTETAPEQNGTINWVYG